MAEAELPPFRNLTYSECMELTQQCIQTSENSPTDEWAAHWMSKAQVYATLTVAAATWRGVDR